MLDYVNTRFMRETGRNISVFSALFVMRCAFSRFVVIVGGRFCLRADVHPAFLLHTICVRYSRF